MITNNNDCQSLKWMKWEKKRRRILFLFNLQREEKVGKDEYTPGIFPEYGLNMWELFWYRRRLDIIPSYEKYMTIFDYAL